MNLDPSDNSKYLYTGQEFDSESELYYYNARYYNPLTGRFISLDPVLGETGSVLSRNGYIYANNNPLKYVDPSGEKPVDEQKELELAQWSWLSNAKKSFDDWVIDVGNGGEYLYNNNSTAKLIMDHPWITGTVIGVGSGLVFVGGSSALTVLSKTFLGGAGTGYIGTLGTGCILNCQSTYNTIVQNAPKYAEQGYKSFEAFKNSVGKADSTGQNLRQWHHLIEQNPTNIEQFGQEILQNAKNIVNIPTQIHQEISAYYSSIQPFTNGITVRSWITAQPFDIQMEFGKKILEKVISNIN